VVIDAVHERETVQRGFAAEEDAACLKLLGEAGITPVDPETIDLLAFRMAVADVVDAAAGKLAPQLRRVFLGTAVE
jgi:hypothetical protein